jgi:predicted negative regulator of RcsB-dependent stress response
MADDIIDAHEQSERARQWLQQNGSSIVMGILLGLAVLLGWQRWQQSSVDHRADAYLKFDELQAAIDKGDGELADNLVQDLRKNFSDTPHAGLAAMKLAEFQLKAGKLPEAESSLRFVTENVKSEAIQSIAAMRLARVLLGRGEAQKALDALKAAAGDAFTAEREQIRGDALLAMGKNDDALKAYDAALAAMDVASQQRAGLEAKRDDLSAGTVSVPAPAEQG